MEKYFEVNGIYVWDFDKIEGEMNNVTAYGAIMMFAIWMQNNAENIDDPIAWDGLGTIVSDVENNTSGVRDGNRLDIHDNYVFSGNLEFSNLYYHKNGIVYAGVYDREKDKFVGYVEINA